MVSAPRYRPRHPDTAKVGLGPGLLSAHRSAEDGHRAKVRPSGTCPGSVGEHTARYPAIMDQYLHPIGPLVGKLVSAVRSGRTKHPNHPRHCRIRAGAHTQRLGRQPDFINADHPSRSRNRTAHCRACSVGHSTTTAPPARSISMRMVLPAFEIDLLAGGE